MKHVSLLYKTFPFHAIDTGYIIKQNNNSIRFLMLQCKILDVHAYGKVYRSTPPEKFLGKGVPKICSKFTEEHPCQSEII